jgi:predicted nucleic acid-binding protein
MQFLIETDVLRDYLISAKSNESVLRKALAAGVCYTTMLNAFELFRAAATEAERDAVMRVLMVVRVLGFNARFAENFAKITQEIETKTGAILSEREAMIVGMASASKLSILTEEHFDRYTSFARVSIVRMPQEVPAGE